jgi:hypothetical protein
MRKVPHSKCEGGLQLDKGPAHVCPGHSRRGGLFWATIAVLPFGLAALAAFWWNRRRSGKGRIRLPEPGEPGRSGVVEFLVSVPWFLIGIVGVAIERLRDIELPFVGRRNRRGGYRSLRLDMDAELLADYDDDEEL